MATEKNLYGLMAEFDSPTELVDAANRMREAGYTKTDAFSPFPIHEMDEALGVKRSILPVLVFCGGIAGLGLGMGPQIFIHYFDYPLNIGGRPYISIPSFVPVAFELTILLSGVTAVFGMLFLNGLPRPYHPGFNVPRFALATREKFFLLIETADPKFEYDSARQFLESLKPQEVFDVEE